jgi:hypothetical protein
VKTGALLNRFKKPQYGKNQYQRQPDSRGNKRPPPLEISGHSYFAAQELPAFFEERFPAGVAAAAHALVARPARFAFHEQLAMAQNAFFDIPGV